MFARLSQFQEFEGCIHVVAPMPHVGNTLSLAARQSTCPQYDCGVPHSIMLSVSMCIAAYIQYSAQAAQAGPSQGIVNELLERRIRFVAICGTGRLARVLIGNGSYG